jgi:hypothetical protein
MFIHVRRAYQACPLTLTDSFGGSRALYVIAVNDSARPTAQTRQLFGCYPAGKPCAAEGVR